MRLLNHGGDPWNVGRHKKQHITSDSSVSQPYSKPSTLSLHVTMNEVEKKKKKKYVGRHKKTSAPHPQPGSAEVGIF